MNLASQAGVVSGLAWFGRADHGATARTESDHVADNFALDLQRVPLAGAHADAQAQRAVLTFHAVLTDRLAQHAAQGIALQFHDRGRVRGLDEVAVGVVDVRLFAAGSAVGADMFYAGHPPRTVIRVLRGSGTAPRCFVVGPAQCAPAHCGSVRG